MAYAMAWTFSCFPYSYKNTDFSQSKLTFSKCYFIYNIWNKLDLLVFITWMNNKKYIHDCIVVELYTRSFFLLCDSQINYTTLQNVSFSKVRVQGMTAGNLQWSTGYEGTQSPRKCLLRRLIMMSIHHWSLKKDWIEQPICLDSTKNEAH